ncbi:conserved oligomeric Golgi complex subunit 7 [Episyrphus balteatus]|uniref:conserved oligomeric Golgi complex subunit 7 n=1 Tax=Episyrphus balteatus TaxID=286459 RepID=UPI002486ACE8|nr:conserved oligomeric Golgi complex subunit 7 [Episyrphus balteatus]
MDISSLSETNFNSTDWINTNFRNFEGKDKNIFISSFVSKLQLYVQQVNFAVEDTSQQLIGNLPRIIKDVKNLHSDVESLQQRMGQVRSEVQAVQEETGDCMESLEKLNRLQTKLQVVKESLQESDGWGNLISELEDSFERNDLMSVCEKLVSLQKSLVAQEKLAGHSERVSQVEDFKNRLEALASPSVVQAFSMSDLTNSQKYVKIFEGISRLPQLKQYYRAVQKTSLQQQWKETIELADNSNNFLLNFYEYLAENCQKQVKWCEQVFGESSKDQPFLILTEVLPVLQPSRDTQILQILKNSNEKLEILEKFANANKTFVNQLNSLLNNNAVPLSKDQTIALSESVFDYFQKFIQQYPRIEESHLFNQIEKVSFGQTNAGDSIHQLENSNKKIFDWQKEACQRCEVITGDLSLCKLIGILNGFLSKVLENYVKTQRQLNLSIHSEQNWTLLQNCMSLLQCLSDFQTRLTKFEKFLYEKMASLEEQITNYNSSQELTIFSICERSELKRLLTSIRDYQQKRTDPSAIGFFPSIYEALKASFIETHDISLTILLSPIEQQLRNIQPHDNANNPAGFDMPAFSFAPQECITQIGQYLLTLPQHLEPLLLSPSPLLKIGLEMCNIKYSQSIPCADVLLSLVVEQCCVMYQSQILQIKTLQAGAAKQLSVDIEYLGNVVEELGLSITLQLSQILNLLKASPENYLSSSAGCEPRLVTAVRQMRNIISTE